MLHSNKKSLFHMVEHNIFKTYFERKCTISNNCTFFEIKYLNTLPGQLKKSVCTPSPEPIGGLGGHDFPQKT